MLLSLLCELFGRACFRFVAFFFFWEVWVRNGKGGENLGGRRHALLVWMGTGGVTRAGLLLGFFWFWGAGVSSNVSIKYVQMEA